MFYDISFLGLWLALALLLGAGVGWWTEVSGAQAPWFFGWFRTAVIAWLVGVVLAWLHWLPGRLGFWLESALLFFAFYILGCLIGGLLRSFFATPAAATAGVAPARQWPLRPGEADSPVAGRASPTPAAATPSAATAVAPRTSAVVSETIVPPLASAVVADEAPAAPAAGEPQPAATVDVVGVPNAAAAAPHADAAKVSGAIVQEPAVMGPLEGEDKHEGQRPQGLVAPRGGVPDDLKHIRGVGLQNEGRLHALGIWHFQQIADWTPENVHWVGSYLAFPGRIDREEWISQAKVLAAGQETEFSRRAERGEVATSRDDGTEGQQNIADVSKIKPHE